MEVFERTGPFYSLEFIATSVGAGRESGLGSALLAFISERADAEGRSIFLAAMGGANRQWYLRHGFRDLYGRSYRAPGTDDVAEWYFMLRDPQSQMKRS